jgi:hypothetical protein
MRTVTVEAGATLQLEADLRPMSAGISPLVWIGGGTVVAAAATAVFFGLSAREGVDPAATRAEAVEFIDARKRDALFADVAIAVGLAGVVTLAVGVLLSEGSDESHASAQSSTQLVIGPSGFGVVGDF